MLSTCSENRIAFGGPQGPAGLSPGRQAEACPTWDKLQVVQASEVRLRGHGRFLAAAAHNGAAGAILLLLAAAPLGAQNGWFQPSLLEKPEVHKAIQSVDDRATGIVDEWIRLVETPAPSGKEQVRAKYIRAEMEKLGLSEIRTDDWSNVSGVRQGTGGGPTVVFAAHMDTVFPEGTDLKVKREGDILRAPGIGDDTSNLMAVLEMFRALNRGGVQTKGDLIFLASVQEEVGLLGAKHWLETSGYKPDLFIATDLSSNQVWYGAFRIDQFKFFYTSPGAHTLESRGAPSPSKAVAKAITALYEIPLPPAAEGFDTFKLPTINIGMLGGGTVVNAIPREAWFTVDLRSLDSATQDRLESSVVTTARHAAEAEGVGFRMEKKMGIDYSKARPKEERLNHPLVQTAVATSNYFRKPGTPAIKAQDAGSTDANIAVSMGIPAVAVGAVIENMPHRLEENAEASSMVPGIKSLIALAVATTTH
jgi:acetylornithine deacetylase/succinyl-diaminopimelate desuccinylase-like protein